jgi:hypothetical protein
VVLEEQRVLGWLLHVMIFGNGKFVCLLLLGDNGERKMREMGGEFSDFLNCVGY